MAERENTVWGEIRVQLSDVQNFLLNGQYKEAVILDKEILTLLVRMQIDQALMVSSSLEGDINQLFEGGVISAQARDTYHGIRAFGELAELGNETSAQDANDSFSMLRDALSSYVDENQEGRREESVAPRVNPNSYGEEAPRLRTDGYNERRATATTITQEEDDGGLGIPIRRNNGRTAKASSASGRTAAGQRNGNVKRRVSGRSGSVQRKGRKTAGQEIDLYNILKIALPVAILLVVVLIIRMIAFPKRKTPVMTTAAVSTTAETAESIETESSTEESTEAAKRYFVTTGVRVRTKPSTTDSEVLTVLEAGTEVDFKSDYNDEWISINYNGQEAYVAKQYVRSETVETTAASTTKQSSSSASNRDGSTTLTVAP